MTCREARLPVRSVLGFGGAGPERTCGPILCADRNGALRPHPRGVARGEWPFPVTLGGRALSCCPGFGPSQRGPHRHASQGDRRGPWEDGPAGSPGSPPRLPAPGLCVSRPFSFCGGRVRTEERGTSGCKVELQMGPSPEELEGQVRAPRTPRGLPASRCRRIGEMPGRGTRGGCSVLSPPARPLALRRWQWRPSAS